MVIILVVLGCILLAVANVALWASLDVFNPGRFGERVAEGLQSDAASEALAGAIVDRIMAEYPDFPPLAQIPAREVVTWLLQRPAFAVVFEEAAAVALAVMTTSAQDVVGIDIADVISNVGSQVAGVVTAINPDAGGNAQAALNSALDAAQESGPLAMYESGRFPKLRGLANTVPWVWPLAGLGAIALLAVAYFRAEDRKSALTTAGAGVLITGLLVLLLIPALQAPVQNSITNPAMQAVIGEVLSALTRGLAIQSILLGFIGAILIVASHFAYKEDEQAQASPAPVAPEQPPAAPAQPSA
jgi:hypothetical protein